MSLEKQPIMHKGITVVEVGHINLCCFLTHMEQWSRCGAVEQGGLLHFCLLMDLDMFRVLGGRATGRFVILYCPGVETIRPAVEQKSDNVRFHVVELTHLL